ncbi:hypothetical protein QBC39DRAFT_345257 [Podospora conica]|nr:hypothetical protein QBC39DRAFT_345257 [Schizothecium conicum]
MCYHRRCIYTCGHYRWGQLVRRCETELRFDKGELAEGCSAMWSHACCTIGAVVSCPKCRDKKANTDDKLAAIKAQLHALKSTIGARTSAESDSATVAAVESVPTALAAAGVESPLAATSSCPTLEEDNDVEDDEVHEEMEEIDFLLLYGQVSFSSDPEHPVPEHPAPEHSVSEQPIPKHPDPEHRPLNLGRRVVSARDPLISESQSTRWGRRWISR